MNTKNSNITISLIVAMGKNYDIGENGDMPWGRNLRGDLRHFVRVTKGKPIVFGRKTFESIGASLKDREVLVLTTRDDYNPEGCRVFQSPDSVIGYVARSYSELIVGGGEKIYKLFLPCATRIYLTVVDAAFEADTFFPEEFKWDDWNVVHKEKHNADNENKYDFTIYTLERK